MSFRVNTSGPATTTRQRDEKMTEDSDYDILRYRTEDEAKEFYGSGWWPRVSNTEVNERRRRGERSLAYNLGGSVKPLGEDDSGEVGNVNSDVEKSEGMKSKLKGLFARKG